MKASRIVVALAFALTSIAAAQEGPPPVAKEMAKLDAMIGNWQGSGIVRMAPGAPEMPWTSTTTTERVLGGHFVMDSMKIEVEGMPVPMIFYSVSGWDSAREKFVSFGMGNAGEAAETTMHFAGNKVITVGSGVEEGMVVADHWVTEYDGDTMRFVGHRSVEGGPFFAHVEGTATRGGDGFSVGPKTADYAMAPPSELMAPLAMLVGTWDFTGDWKPAPGAEAMQISGGENIDSILGGHAIRSHVKGHGGGMDFEAFNFMAWCPDDNCVVSVGCNNMGEINMAKCWVDGNTLVTVGAGVGTGTPMAMRGVLTMSENELTWEAHATSGTDEPYRAFTGTLTRAER